MAKAVLRSCLLNICLCGLDRKLGRRRNAAKVGSTVNSSLSFEVVQVKEEATFMNQVHVSRQVSAAFPDSHFTKVRTLPVDATFCGSLLARHEDLNWESTKAGDYGDVGGVVIRRKRIREVTEEETEATYRLSALLTEEKITRRSTV